ncbi:dihydropteroate synthase [Croceivirga lutea]|uniref:dihydropteroate synthase n=1 Tax=Croceivirga lutea TaxID=1775167 RepID=UPI001639A227|nr:dihydropteroate synthase [Croceivirga lutea]GGG51489.1 dihydropteroate synthase [Croceivirga lutea]
MTINCKGQLVDFIEPKVMGILNLTPDSFYDGGKYKDEKSVLNQIDVMQNDGATFIDIGGYSSRPGATDISIDEELHRVIPIIELVLKHHPKLLISVDTFRSQVAKKAVAAGAAMVNDISGGDLDSSMYSTIAELQVPYILMHMRGNPQNMAQKTSYDDLIRDIFFELSKKIEHTVKHKINDVIIDPGFGFAKTAEQNFCLLKNLSFFSNLDKPLLVGLSRKSMLWKTLKISAKEALNATTSANTIALLNGANILRVHDVKEAHECIKIVTQLKNAEC